MAALREQVEVQILTNHKQFIHTSISDNMGCNSFLFTAIYGSPIPSLREFLWKDLLCLSSRASSPWLLAGDFNATVARDERKGGSRCMQYGCRSFRDFIHRAELLDLGFSGPRFTWQRGDLMVRLDRALCNDKWITFQPNTVVMHLPKIQSDHRPLLIKQNGVNRAHHGPFRYLASWAMHLDFSNLVAKAWSQGKSLAENIEHFSQEAQRWNAEVFGKIGRNKHLLRARISGVQCQLERFPYNLSLVDLEHSLLSEYENICLQEEIMWMQKSRSQWIKDGDRNTNFYHTKALQRRRRNRIMLLKDENGHWEGDQDKLRKMATNYFHSLYSTDQTRSPPYNITGQFPPISDPLLLLLDYPVSKEEIKGALFDMHPLKSPGVDGLHASFFQSQWEIVGDSLYTEIRAIFNGGEINPSFNQTLISLIPKVDFPQTLKEFRPISLCTTVYKIITKILANRLKPAMDLLTLPYQTSFIKGRSITDNIIIAQEAIHSMRRKTGKTGWMAIKVDLEKAFDRLSWDFITDTLRDAKLPERTTLLIMKCIRSTSMQVLWNGKPSEVFYPSRGIRQGDPLSPYIFVLCMERLSQAIYKEVSTGEWQTIRMGRNGQPLSHLFFADDLILFSTTTTSQIQLVNKLLGDFCASSGQKVSKAKTRIYFSKNVTPQMSNSICNLLGFGKTDNLGKYLGVPMLHGRVTKDTYKYIEDKVHSKLFGWKGRSLSLAGRITLAQSVLSALPLYAMQSTRLLASTCNRIQSYIKQFV